jgi:hypothetical protein
MKALLSCALIAIGLLQARRLHIMNNVGQAAFSKPEIQNV